MAVRKSVDKSAPARLVADDGDRNAASRPSGDAAGLQKRLHDEIARDRPATAPVDPAPAETAEPQVELHPAADRRAKSEDRRKQPPNAYSKVIKSLIGLAVVIVVGWMPVKRLFETSSVQAVVNATIVTVRSPINGVVGGQIGALSVGNTIESGNPLVAIENPRVDTNAVDHATEMIATHEADLAGVRQRIAGLQAARAEVANRVGTYRLDRARRLAARLDEAEARIRHYRAERDMVAADLGRLSTLSGKDGKSRADAGAMNLRLVSANATLDEHIAAKAVLIAERDALNAGRFLGDDYNDAPRSAQRVDDLGEMIIQLQGDETRMATRLKSAREELAQELEQIGPLRYAPLDAPVSGRVWEVLTAPGEQVVAGQHLLSLVDCSKLIVTAAVSESVYNYLSLGLKVRFLLDGSPVELPGTVVQLSGVAAASSNFAINPSALQKEAYRVGVSIETKALGGACPVGRTGRVVFKAS